MLSFLPMPKDASDYDLNRSCSALLDAFAEFGECVDARLHKQAHGEDHLAGLQQVRLTLQALIPTLCRWKADTRVYGE